MSHDASASGAPLYPIHLNLEGRLCVVVGGGRVAERKVIGLLAARARVRVVSLEATPALRRLAECGEIELVSGAYDRVAVEDAELVFAATDRREVNAEVGRDAAAQGALVNVADAPEEGDFVTPAVVRRGALCLSVTTGGNQPLLSGRIASELEARFGPEYAGLVDLLGKMRAEIRSRTAESERRRAAYEALLAREATLHSLLAAGDSQGAEAHARAIVEEVLG